jgi:hypothetical protein
MHQDRPFETQRNWALVRGNALEAGVASALNYRLGVGFRGA